MKLLEYQGKKMFKKYGIMVPKGKIMTSTKMPSDFLFGDKPGLMSPKRKSEGIRLNFPLVLKAQTPSGNRKLAGGIIEVKNKIEFNKAKKELFNKIISGHRVKKILVEEKIIGATELYLSFSYSTETRGPVLSISNSGGTGIASANIFPIDLSLGLPDFYLREICLKSEIKLTPTLKNTIQNLWKMFWEEKMLLAEINPLFQIENECIAGDAKIILDDNVVDPTYRPFLNLGGDIAILASGGGASLINLDALMAHGGHPANYVEYSGNPKAEIVEALTKKVLSRPNLKGCWVIGGTANFTDIHETMLGFVNGLRKVKPKPTYPIVIRRDGPKREEAFVLLREVGKKEGYNFHLYGSEISMSESGKIMTKLAYKNARLKVKG